MAKTGEKAKAPEVVQISDAELVRQLRLDREAKLWPSVPKTDALLRQYDSLQALHDKTTQDWLNTGNALEEATDKLASYVNDLASLEEERKGLLAANASLVEQSRKLADFILENVPGEPSQDEGAVDCAIRLLRSVYTARAAEVPAAVVAEYHATSLPATLPVHSGSVLRIVPPQVSTDRCSLHDPANTEQVRF